MRFWRAVKFLSSTTPHSPGGQRAGSAQLCSETHSCALLSLCRINSGSGSVLPTQEGMCPGFAVLSSVIYSCSLAWKVNTSQTRDKLTCGSAWTPYHKSFPPRTRQDWPYLVNYKQRDLWCWTEKYTLDKRCRDMSKSLRCRGWHNSQVQVTT